MNKENTMKEIINLNIELEFYIRQYNKTYYSKYTIEIKDLYNRINKLQEALSQS
jgi:hypothetical protein